MATTHVQQTELLLLLPSICLYADTKGSKMFEKLTAKTEKSQQLQ
jgi:hypothetical protein